MTDEGAIAPPPVRVEGLGSNPLEGNGAPLVRERALATAIQRALERVYQLDRVADVNAFVAVAEGGEREALLFRHSDDGALELSLRIPHLARREFDVANDGDLDPLCQIVEGVSHFVYITHRAAEDREATQLELELQAEVDKYVVLAAALRGLDMHGSGRLRKRLYEQVSFSHEAGTELGDRYRVANTLAHRFTGRLEREFVATARYREMHEELRKFFRVGQEGKLRMGRAA